ncbi:MAG: [FeFe] hydrogenase H-cluster maturation GTPase HydF [Candidatus Omnitrophica bacterium]|nr:[FeFe] hydrogenase H-cluster maturation GTPase HydF [Candidatus Omnitrophota bacterium]
MLSAPKSVRLHIGLFGRTNVGKSSFLNMIVGQDVAITSPQAGTTTDVVEKPMELLPLGPVLFLDTAGLDDASALSAERLRKTRRVFEQADIVALVTEPEQWAAYEEQICAMAAERKQPLAIIVNKCDVRRASEDFLQRVRQKSAAVVCCSSRSIDGPDAERAREELKRLLLWICPEDFLRAPPLLGDIIPAGGMAVMIVPIDLQAPKGRLILPQVQAIRDALDHDAFVCVVKEREYAALLQRLALPPDLVVCDSQVMLKMIADTPPAVACTTFSILLARQRGDLRVLAAGAAAIDGLRSGDRILIAESCSHHALEDDIGRVKIPRWMRQYAGVDLQVDVCSGKDFPADLSRYSLIVQCGGCMLNRREMLYRIQQAQQAAVPITNYGVCIAAVQGAMGRVLGPFPAALAEYEHVRRGQKGT